jgi:hypothetical protein
MAKKTTLLPAKEGDSVIYTMDLETWGSLTRHGEFVARDALKAWKVNLWRHIKLAGLFMSTKLSGITVTYVHIRK